jgi:hypothetical protein
MRSTMDHHGYQKTIALIAFAACVSAVEAMQTYSP